MPYSKPLEDIAYPHEPQIVNAALANLNINEPSPSEDAGSATEPAR